MLWTAVAVLVLAQAAMRWWALSQSFFFQDDFVYTNLARTLPTTDFLALDYQGHLQPVQFALVAVLARLAPLDWTPHAAVLLGLQLVFDVVFTWLPCGCSARVRRSWSRWPSSCSARCRCHPCCGSPPRSSGCRSRSRR